MAIGTIAIALALTACGETPSPATPATSAPAVTATPVPTSTPDTAPAMVGTLKVLIALTTPDSVVPQEPLSYSLAVTQRGDSVATMIPVDADGTFTLALPPGTYDMEFLEIRAADLGPEPIALPIAAGRKIVLRVPEAGCRYGGEVNVVYARLPAGSQKQQQALVERASRNNKENYSFVYRADGGFVLAGANVTVPASAERPSAASGCEVDKFRVAAA